MTLAATWTKDMTASIPFHRPYICGQELTYLTEAVVRSGIGSDGSFTRRCAELLQNKFAVPRVLMTPSCTAALEMAALLCDLHPGDEVIMPSYTFVSTANAFVLAGGTPVFVDVQPETMNLDP